MIDNRRSFMQPGDDGERPVFGIGIRTKLVSLTTLIGTATSAGVATFLFVVRGVPLNTAAICGTAIIPIVLVVFIYMSVIKNRIRTINRAIEEFRPESMKSRLYVRNHDEIGSLEKDFNTMADAISLHCIRQDRLIASVGRFIPHGIPQLFRKKNISEIEHGDFINGEMSILYIEIQDYETLVKSMTVEELFEFSNEFLRKVGPEIREYGGYIHESTHRSVTALFTERPDDCIDAAIAISRNIKRSSSSGGKKDLEQMILGIGVTFDRAVYGFVGEIDRLNPTIASKALEAAVRCAETAGKYSIGILVSGQTLKSATDLSKYHYRYVDRIVPGKHSESMTIYEIYDADDPVVVGLKNAVKQEYEVGIKLYLAGRIQQAFAIFNALRDSNPDDPIVDLYIARCQYRITHGKKRR
jgi:class 3 adenylate cyclase